MKNKMIVNNKQDNKNRQHSNRTCRIQATMKSVMIQETENTRNLKLELELLKYIII